MEIRYLSPQDNPADVSFVYEQSWKHAYKGIVPQSYLDSIPSGRWIQSISKSDMYNLVALEHRRIIGTSSYCASRWKKFDGFGEIVSIYFLPEYTGKGYGSALLSRAIAELRKLEYREILLWVLEENISARSFYEKNGFVSTGEYMDDKIAGKQLRELLYVLKEN